VVSGRSPRSMSSTSQFHPGLRATQALCGPTRSFANLMAPKHVHLQGPELVLSAALSLWAANPFPFIPPFLPYGKFVSISI